MHTLHGCCCINITGIKNETTSKKEGEIKESKSKLNAFIIELLFCYWPWWPSGRVLTVDVVNHTRLDLSHADISANFLALRPVGRSVGRTDGGPTGPEFACVQVRERRKKKIFLLFLS